jgi:hypothetical protein
VPFFGFGTTELTDDQLRQTLFDLVAKKKTRALKKLISQRHDRVRALFPTWKVLPPEIRHDAHQTTWWAQGMIGIASAATELGDSSLGALLLGDPRKNILMLWGQALIAAQTEVERQHHTEAIGILEDALKYADGLTGSACDEYLPKHYGLLGHAYYLAGNLESARTYTIRARNYCVRIQDQEGVAIYTSNLARIDSA